MSSDAATGRDHPPLDEEPQATSPSDAYWADGFADTSPNWFSDEIENVSASDWDEDTAQIWGDDSGSAAADEDGIGGLDFSL